MEEQYAKIFIFLPLVGEYEVEDLCSTVWLYEFNQVDYISVPKLRHAHYSPETEGRLDYAKKKVTCYNQVIVAIVDVLTSFNFFPRSIQSVIFFSTFLLLRC
jgi:hypothetical protein